MSGVRPIDKRRATALRAALAEMAPWLAPEWAGLDQEGDFGAALYEIAARLAEHSTRRLDQVPLRDKLAFLDTLDIAATAPRSATVPIVFMLAEKRAEPVYAPPRVQIAAPGDDAPVVFETKDGLTITPARLLRLIAADPAADRIELAPPAVIAPPQPGPPPVTYRLVGAAETGKKTLQLAQAVGLEAGDLLRIGNSPYRIDTLAGKAGEIVTLIDALEAPAPAGAAIEKITQLESFNLRNLNAHIAYVGHKELLKLDGPATIALRLDPPGLARRLSQLDVDWELWGKKKGDDAAGWQALRLLGVSDGELRLRKDWDGSVEEVEAAEGNKSRWIRLTLRTPISDAAPPDTRAASLALKVSSNAPPAAATGTGGAAAEGSRSIVSAFYNGLPLPLTTAFLPFGPEPQRFDTFAIAAPEALSKKGAAVTLKVALSDASLGSLAATTGAPDRIYGVGRNGRLQGIRFEKTGVPSWRQFDPPPPTASGDGAAVSPRLDEKSAFYAFQSQAGPAANDIIVVRDKDKALWTATVRIDTRTWAVTKWIPVRPRDGEPPPDSFCVAYAIVAGQPISWLVAAGPTELYAQKIDAAGATSGWEPLAPSPADAMPKLPLRLAPVTDGDGLIVAIDAAKAVWRGKVSDKTVEWVRLAPDNAAGAVQPVAVMHEEKVHVVVADPPSSTIFMLREGLERLDPPSKAMAGVGTIISIACLPAQPEKPDLPLVAAVGADKAVLWSEPKRATAAPLPLDAICSVLATPGSATGVRLILGAPDERLLHAAIEDGTQTLDFAASDALPVDAGTTPVYRLVDGKPTKIDTPLLTFPNDTLLPVAPGTLKPGASYVMLAPVPGGAGTGTKVPKDPRQMVLDASDTWTNEHDYLEIGGKPFAIASLKQQKPKNGGQAEGSKKTVTVTLDADLPDTVLAYATFRKGKALGFNIANQSRLLDFGTAILPGYVKRFEFAGSASPGEQTFTQPTGQPAGENWVRVDAAWSTVPEDGPAGFTVPLDAIGAWTQVSLPRSTENPELSWEYFDGRGWRRLDAGFRDGTANLASTGKIDFTVPPDLAPTDVAGKQDYWIRARLVGGDYGRPSYIVETSGTRQSITVDRSSLNPPEIVSIEASYDLQDYAPPDLVLTVNNLAAVDQTQAAAAAGAEFDLFEGLAAHTGDPPGLGRAIYLCLSRAPDVDSLSLYADAADVGAAARRLQAEVLRPEGWKAIVCDDRTAGLARPGLLLLSLSAAPAQLPLFGCDGWWLRLRPLESSAGWAPIVRGLSLNAVTAEQAETVEQEILGASLGEPDQSYTLAEAPVLPETLDLRVRESLSDEEKAALLSADPAAIAVYPNVEGEWVRWRATDSFVDQGGGARVFRLDPSSGAIRFGNGRDGKIPPAGRDAIRAVSYQSSEGSRGNVPAYAAKQLKTALESVELAINPVDAGGGADAPPKERLADTAPARLRHAGRALAPSDIEALATGSSPDVVRARCLRSRGCGIDLVVAIRQTGARCPVPSRARREGIQRIVADAGWGALAPDAIRVRAPDYVHIGVDLVVIAASAEAVPQVEHEVRAAIVAFLHPVEGGPGGLGWPFGRRPWPSDLQRVAAAVSRVDRIDVAIAARDAGADLDRLKPDTLICAEEEAIRITVQPPRSGR